jgi:hypothetical protein
MNLLYALGLGSPTYPLPTESYAAWTATYHWRDIYSYELLYGGGSADEPDRIPKTYLTGASSSSGHWRMRRSTS